MPKVVLGHSADEVPLTVASVARKLGVSPSTLRTWERRYGMAPSARTLGSHRRYTAVDVARLQVMCHLMEQGISASDAAHQALAAEESELDVDVTCEATVPALVQAVNAADDVLVRSIIDRAIATDGLVCAWTTLICPALREIEDHPQLSAAGNAPRVLLRSAILRAIRQVVRCCDTSYCPAEGTPPEVVVAAPTDSVISGHVLAAALQWQGVLAGVVSTSPAKLGGAISDCLADNRAHALIIVDAPEGICQTIEQLESVDDLVVYLVGCDAPCPMSERVTRLHTISAAVAEIAELSAQWQRDSEGPRAAR